MALGWRILRRLGNGRAPLSPAAHLREGALFGTAAVVLATVAASGAHDPFFAWVRLVCQAIFGEGVLLLSALSVRALACGGRLRGAVLGAAAVGLVGVYWEAYHHGPRDLRVRTLDVGLAIPTASALRRLHQSDIQTHSVGEHERRAIRAGLALRPDLVVLTGDYLQRGLSPLRPEARRDIRALLSALLELADGRSLALTGLRARTSRTGDPELMRRILGRGPRADLRVVFGHSPDFVRALAGWAPVDLALAGHTHGGQVVLPGFGPLVTLSRLPRRYAGGLNDYAGIPLHVSRGVGLERGSAPPIRFLCPPEVSLLRLRSESPGLRSAGD
jgi:predicted MPP superfamily phosphohydrolase